MENITQKHESACSFILFEERGHLMLNLKRQPTETGCVKQGPQAERSSEQLSHGCLKSHC